MAAVFGGLQEDTYDRQYSDGYLIRRIISYFARYKLRLGVVGGGFLTVAVLSSLPPIFIAWGVNLLEDGGEDNESLLTVLIGALVIAAVLQFLFNLVRRRGLSIVVGSVVAELRKDGFSAALERDMAFYDKHKSGKIVSRITSDTQEFGNVVMLASDVVAMMIEVAIILVVLITTSWSLTVLLMVTVPFIVGAAMGLRWLARVVTRQGARAMAAVNDTIQESVAGISVAKNFRREAMIYDEFVAINLQSYRINLKRDFILALVFPTMQLIAGVAIAFILYMGAQYILWGLVNVGAWFLFVQAANRFWFPFINMAAIWSQFQQALSAVERIFALIDAENTVVQNDSVVVDRLKGLIEIKDVTFEYEPEQPVLQSFDLTIEEGEDVAFVGHTGAGKSTIGKIITRFYEFQSGDVHIDGQDIRSFDLQSYRSRLGIVPQQPFLFSGTVRDNIRYGCPGVADEEIEAVALSVGKGEWLETLPGGLDTDVGERGSRLSMGQRQLVSLMRVLLAKPAIFILDEATASIDPFTEMQIQEALNIILARSTSILIAHRLSTVRNADRIIVLKDGHIIEQGNHEALMEQGGHYAELYNTYFRHQSLRYVESAREMFMETESG